MNGKLFRKKVDQLWSNLMANAEQINRGENDIIGRAEEILMETDGAIRQLKIILRQYKFADWSEEIYFFKNTKPQFVAMYIYYSKILSIEASKPFADPDVLKSYYQNERNNLLYFYGEQKDFINYYRRKSTFLDKKYFMRFKFDFKLKLSPELYSYDEEFSTSHDHLVSQIIANDLMEQYLTNKINSSDSLENPLAQVRKLEWTAPKVALTELLYGLYQSNCFNGGHADLAEVFRWAENSFEINLGNYHKTLAEIRLRKTDRAKFLSLIRQNLNQYLDDLDI
ncbi:RteC domain-containing protein [Elizabethkingia meningoseptica]|uniref:RteC domain-containing protein n=1 Tax=Elizabethkingia meningoseptica TaxID=238 RepID=UPI0022F1C8C7|nr:RteC domain-containing protein [Elizabethkingia meningoseptica]EJK5328083.1 RteC domain-containing protein [Elizabethkingia meningoseptica]WBS74154.1 RteC domain-containing protein [Elizabethkingia meningoseptica]